MIICQHAIINVGGSTTAAVATATTTNQYRNSQREYGRCTHTALMGGPPASLGAADQSPEAVSDFITLHRRNNSPQLKSLTLPTPWDPDEYAMAAGGGGSNKKRGNDGEKEHRAMSAISLAMMNREANNDIHSEQMRLNHDSTHDLCSAICDNEQSQQDQEYTSTLPFSSSPARAAFHDPPPLYPDDIQQAQSSGMTGDDETFLDTLPKSPFSQPMVKGASSNLCESGSISLWNYEMSDDQLDAIFIGGGYGADTTFRTVSLLHEKCANEGKPRLKMFASTGSVERVDGSGLAATDANSTPSSNFSSLKDQLSNFRSFGASVSVGGEHDTW